MTRHVKQFFGQTGRWPTAGGGATTWGAAPTTKGAGFFSRSVKVLPPPLSVAQPIQKHQEGVWEWLSVDVKVKKGI